MDIRELKQYNIDAILGAIGAFLILGRHASQE